MSKIRQMKFEKKWLHLVMVTEIEMKIGKNNIPERVKPMSCQTDSAAEVEMLILKHQLGFCRQTMARK